jgi:hypothetical protein
MPAGDGRQIGTGNSATQETSGLLSCFQHMRNYEWVSARSLRLITAQPKVCFIFDKSTCRLCDSKVPKLAGLALVVSVTRLRVQGAHTRIRARDS